MKNATYHNQAQQFKWRATGSNGSTKPRSRFQPNPFGEDKSCWYCKWDGECQRAIDVGGLVLACTLFEEPKKVTKQVARPKPQSPEEIEFKDYTREEICGIASDYPYMPLADLSHKYHRRWEDILILVDLLGIRRRRTGQKPLVRLGS